MAKARTAAIKVDSVDLYVLTQALKRAQEAGLLSTVCVPKCADRVMAKLVDAKQRMPL